MEESLQVGWRDSSAVTVHEKIYSVSFDDPTDGGGELFHLGEQAGGEEAARGLLVGAFEGVALGKDGVGIEVDVVVNESVTETVEESFGLQHERRKLSVLCKACEGLCRGTFACPVRVVEDDGLQAAG